MEITTFDNGKKKKGPDVPGKLTEAEKKYFYENPDAAAIFTPLYEVYNEVYTYEITGGLNIFDPFSHFKDTSWFEKYMTNLYQFSAAKSVETARKMQAAVYDPVTKQLRSWSQFKQDADAISKQENEVWLRVERDNCARQAILADKFTQMREDRDVYPYWIYKGRLDSRERPEHRALEGLIFRIGDYYGDAFFPPSDWNCRCTGQPLDHLGSRVAQTNDQARAWLEANDPDTGKPFVNPQFRYNPADQGMLPKVGDQFVHFKNANEGDSDLFGISGPSKPSLHAHQPLEHLPSIVRKWKEEYYTDRLGNICVQNKDLLSNVWITHYAIQQIHAHPRGSNLLPQTVQEPSEVWARWEDIDKQQHVLREYIHYAGDTSAYVVSTRDGAVQDAKLISRHQTEKHRIGVPWIK